MARRQDIAFHKTPDGRVHLAGGEWPLEVEISSVVLEVASTWVQINEEGFVEISVMNGCATYRLTNTRDEDDSKVYTCRLVRGFMGVDP